MKVDFQVSYLFQDKKGRIVYQGIYVSPSHIPDD
jgi:hypothetical protein